MSGMRVCVGGWLSLVLAVAATAQPVAVTPATMHRTCGGLAAAERHLRSVESLELPAELRGHYETLATRAGVPVQELWAPLAADYLGRSFGDEKTIAVLRTQYDLMTARGSKELVASLPAGSKDAIILIADPLCSECRAKLRWIAEAQEDCGAAFPPVVIDPVPSGEETSVRAAAMLEYIRRHAPRYFEDAARSFIEIMPDHPTVLERLLEPYREAIGAIDCAELDALMKAGRDKAAHLTRVGLHSSLVVYRGRVIERHTFDHVAFDPFRSLLHFETTVAMMQMAGE